VTYKVEIDPHMCISSGTCVAEASDAFELNGLSVARPTAAVSQVSDDRLVLIARRCPSGAIALYDEQGNEVDVFE
jgi:ferredoxin